MKLIDLLVQEFPTRGGWPSNADECTQCVIDGEITLHGNCKPRSGIYLALADDWDEVRITREQYEAALAASKQVEWDGVGLPPVGIKCLTVGPHGDDSFYECTILAHTEFSGTPVAVFQYGDTISHSSEKWFKPLAAEAERKREAAIKQMMERSAVLVEATAGLIYDAIAAGEIPGVKLDDI